MKRFCLTMTCCLAGFAAAAAQPVGAYTVIVTERVSENKHTEQVAIIEGDDETYMFHRAVGDTVTIEEGFKIAGLYCFRNFTDNGEVTVCKIEDDTLYGLSLNDMGFLFSFTSGENNPMTPDMADILGIYNVVCGQDGVDNTYEAVLNVYPDGPYLWVEQDFDGDENAEKTGFGLVVEGILVVAMAMVGQDNYWNITAYQFSEDGNARGRWLTRFFNDETLETETVSGWETLTSIQDSAEVE